MLQPRILFILLLSLLILQGCIAAVATGAAVGSSIAYDRRTTGALIDDQGIEYKSASALYENKTLYEQSHINVTSYNGIVLITGETPSEEMKKEVSARIKVIPKVRIIHNELIIAAPSALPSRSSDSWITSKVKTKLAADQSIDPMYVKVVTERGIVYMMGIVTHAEANQAVNVAQHSAGVQRVVKIFEYQN